MTAGADCSYRMAHPGRRFALGSEVRGTLEVWRWFSEEALDARGETLSGPMYHWRERPLHLLCFQMHVKP